MAMNQTVGAPPYNAVRTISAEALSQKLRSNVPITIVDVRDRAQVHETGTIAGARMFPLYQLASRIDELVDLRATPVVVVSQTARRARLAALELEAAGFGEVAVLEGGLQRWVDAGFSLEERRDSVPSSRF